MQRDWIFLLRWFSFVDLVSVLGGFLILLHLLLLLLANSKNKGNNKFILTRKSVQPLPQYSSHVFNIDCSLRSQKTVQAKNKIFKIVIHCAILKLQFMHSLLTLNNLCLSRHFTFLLSCLLKHKFGIDPPPSWNGNKCLKYDISYIFTILPT